MNLRLLNDVADALPVLGRKMSRQFAIMRNMNASVTVQSVELWDDSVPKRLHLRACWSRIDIVRNLAAFQIRPPRADENRPPGTRALYLWHGKQPSIRRGLYMSPHDPSGSSNGDDAPVIGGGRTRSPPVSIRRRMLDPLPAIVFATNQNDGKGK
jgi:hypothetical protein